MGLHVQQTVTAVPLFRVKVHIILGNLDGFSHDRYRTAGLPGLPRNESWPVGSFEVGRKGCEVIVFRLFAFSHNKNSWTVTPRTASSSSS